MKEFLTKEFSVSNIKDLKVILSLYYFFHYIYPFET